MQRRLPGGARAEVDGHSCKFEWGKRMIISHWLYPVEVLGPGKRLAIWMQGCRRRCRNCVSPELQDFEGTEYEVPELAKICNGLIEANGLEGVTISGGEPFEQREELLRFCKELACDDILVYSGYSIEELTGLSGDRLAESGISVLITNPYIEELNDDKPLRGSSNQEIIYIDPDKKEAYLRYLEENTREQQFFVEDSTVYMAGIPGKGQSELIRDMITVIMEEGT